MKAVASAIGGDGKADYLNVIAGTNMDRLLHAEHWPPTPARHGLFVHLAADIRSSVRWGQVRERLRNEAIMAIMAT